MKVIKLSMLASVMLVAGITSVKAQTADEIMEKRKAASGSENWSKIKTMKINLTMKQQGMDIPMTQTIVVDKAARVDITFMGMNNYQIINGNQGWKYMPIMGSDKVDTMKAEEIATLKEQVDFKKRQTVDYKADGGKAELDGKDTINNTMCYKVKVTDKDGDATTYFIDSKTYYTVRTESTVKKDEQEQEVTTTFDNYQKLDEGIVLPMAITTMGVEVAFKSVEINKPVDESIFKPDAKK
jgi:hypothetical protein